MILDSMARPTRIICIYRIGNMDIEMWCDEIAGPTCMFFDSMAISTYIWCACITTITSLSIHHPFNSHHRPPPKKKKNKKKNKVAWPICLILDIKARPIHMIYTTESASPPPISIPIMWYKSMAIFFMCFLASQIWRCVSLIWSF